MMVLRFRWRLFILLLRLCPHRFWLLVILQGRSRVTALVRDAGGACIVLSLFYCFKFTCLIHFPSLELLFIAVILFFVLLSLIFALVSLLD